MSTIDPNTGQLIELPIDQGGAYVVQDGAGVLTSAQIQAGVQGGKSLLKPELAQHLNQHVGYKSTVGRGGFTLGANDQRWVNVNTPRPNRSISRKPLGSSGGHLQPGTVAITQASALAPAASGLLSLGSRYTPSSATAFGGGNPSIGGTFVTAAGPGGLVSAGVGALGVERDSNYRLAAAIAGTGGRGRPRGRRPLRGQFPVVPIDMVRQLGIEQQVILQPAAPVAMRNKAILCRPLSMCRKTQANVIGQYEGVSHDGSASIQTEAADLEALSSRKLSPLKKEPKTTRLMEVVNSDEELSTPESARIDIIEEENVRKPETLDAETATLPSAVCMDSETQTDADNPEATKPLFVPIPIPVPIYVPTPVCLYARPVPFVMPFPLPCVVPLPITVGKEVVDTDEHLVVDSEASRGSEDEDREEDDTHEKERGHDETEQGEDESALMTEELVKEVEEEEEEVESDALRCISDAVLETGQAVAEEESDNLVIAADSIVSEAAEEVEAPQSEPVEHQRSRKRHAPSPVPEEEADSSQSPHHQSEPTHIGPSDSAVSAVTSHSSADVMSETQQHQQAKVMHSVPVDSDSAQPPAKRPRRTIVVSDANYHLKFSYGINAWRHWVQQKLAGLGGIGSAVVQEQYPHLRTELINMSEKDLNLTLSQFVREVRKPNNECYVADSIFYLCLGIQEYLNENGCTVNIFGGPTFADFSKALDNILANFQPRISPEGLLICRIEEEHLWEAQQLGEHTPEILLFTMLYFNTKHFGLRLGSAHRQLSFSQFRISEEPDESNAAILCHLPGTIFGGSAGETTTLRLSMNYDYPERCPVHLFKTYLTRCPPNLQSSGSVFYLVPNYPHDPNSDVWYSPTPMDSSELQVILNRIKMVKEIQEAFMNGQPDGGF
ncbi:unnamed protein product [Calicophoron daubneyi]|uniref:DUF3504 domain-containing protein n=1 Tax=Calicophoron daubneyi TaxID=300641 RepID=A0AAV2TDS1_CALDB